ncbi:uncharacterized protein MONBRDRAFT_23390 [Monosiga brevicollis MX1]|uniref:Anaphase-promoting complex subunit 4 WD40 domain-containing protein n=1 Tax=Monosiga brevicollis TaxID=81824 RepID=A9UT92_MONBE|nr:uncharacterized protein MONBRDRAFT_23390 [Monosiga brevicollis MX1]EDQ91206.1 predicted protein [Monosiga brevicollis MX1]|eukprot:XP_001743628.1 hypothetical protein [Monosiga brevicollis MX1]
MHKVRPGTGMAVLRDPHKSPAHLDKSSQVYALSLSLSQFISLSLSLSLSLNSSLFSVATFHHTGKMNLQELQKLYANAESRTHALRSNGHSKTIHGLRFNADGTLLASSGIDKLVIVHEPGTNGQFEEAVKLEGHTSAVDQVAFHPQNTNILASASDDKSVKLWDVRAKQRETTSVTTDDGNINLKWHPDCNLLAVGNRSDVITLFDTRTWQALTTKQYEIEVNGLSWNNDATGFFLTTGRGSVRVLHPETLEPLCEDLTAHTSNCLSIEFSPCGRYFATGSADATVSLFDAHELICFRTHNSLDGVARSIGFSYDGDVFAACSPQDHLDLIHTESDAVLHSIKTGKESNAVTWHPTKHMVALAHSDSSLPAIKIVGS